MTSDLPTNAGRYIIEALLGRGAMGVVYKAWDPLIHRHVAIKMVRDTLLEGQERADYLARFLNEARLGGLCDHPNIVSLYDMSGSDEEPYLVLQYVDGLGLNKALPRGVQLSLSEVIPVALQVLTALDYAHTLGIVHRDVKPANIILTYQGQLKITDFGVSHNALLSEPETTPLLIGTPNYMSPEQCSGRAVDSRSDLFSFGCILYELLSGQKAFEGREYTDTVFRILNLEPEPLSGIRSDLPAGIISALARVFAKDPNDRFATARDFAEMLRRAAPEFDLSSPLPQPYQQPPAELLKDEEHDQEEPSEDHAFPDITPDIDYDDDATLIITAEEELPPLSHPDAEDEWLAALETHLQNLYGPISRHELRSACETASTKEQILALVIKNKRHKKDLLALFLPAKPKSKKKTKPVLSPAKKEKQAVQSVTPEPAQPEPRQQKVAAPEPKQQTTATSEPAQPLTDDDIAFVSDILTDVLGPVAAPVMRRASLRAKDFTSLISLCESYIKRKGDQERFRNLIKTSGRT